MRRFALLCTCGAMMGLVPAALAGTPDEVTVTLRPYLWAPTIKGDVGISEAPIGDITVPVDSSFLDYADQLQGALLLMTEVRKGRWGLAVDGVWMRLGGDGATPGPFLSTVDVQMDTVLLSIAPTYCFVETPRVSAAVLAGGRYVYLRQNMDLSPDYAAVGTVSAQVIDTAVPQLASVAKDAVGDASAKVSKKITGLNTITDGKVEDAINDVKVDLAASITVNEILERGGGFADHGVLPEEQRLVEAVQNAVAERAADLVTELNPVQQRNPELVDTAISKAASESLDDLKKHVSSSARKAIEHAESALHEKVTDGMTEVANADAIESRDWVDPFVGLRATVVLAERWTLMTYGDVGGFGVGSELTWQLFGGLSWDASDTVSIEAGYRHLDIDYDHDHFIFDASMSGFAAGVLVKL